MDSTNGLIHSMIQLVALKNFKAGLYALAILDIIMPQMDGFELYHELTKIDCNVKACFITAYEVNYQAFRAIFPRVINTDEHEALPVFV
jgi:CheY-like chemotaxis protein